MERVEITKGIQEPSRICYQIKGKPGLTWDAKAKELIDLKTNKSIKITTDTKSLEVYYNGAWKTIEKLIGA